MKILQQDIQIKDFILRIKKEGEWIRLDTSAGMEADDYHLDFDSRAEITALCMLKEKYDDEYMNLFEALRNHNMAEVNKILGARG